MTDPNAPGHDDDRLPDDGAKPPLETEEHESGSGAGRKTNVQRPPGDQTQQPDPDQGESPLTPRRR